MAENYLDGIVYELIFSERKTVGISVKDGRVIVRAPRRTSPEKIKDIVKKHLDWIKKALSRFEEKQKKHPDPSPLEEKKLRAEARLYFTAKTKEYSEKMGLKYGRITITSAKTRFGSCSSKGNIAFSYRLMMYPDEAIDYVVVHELAHLKEMNHSPAFYKIIAKVLPDYKERIKLLTK